MEGLSMFESIPEELDVTQITPPKHLRNAWYFANLKDPIGKQVWDLGQDYYARIQLSKDGRRTKVPVPLIKAGYFMYLSGCRQQEVFIKPYPTMEIINTKKGTYVNLTHVNEKHKGMNGEREVIPAAIPIFDQWERNMWAFITDGGTEYDARRIFAYDSWRNTRNDNITNLFKDNFKIDLKDDFNGVVHRQAGLVPHILRHMRAYNVLVENKVKRPPLIMKWFGWDSSDMIYYYSHIKKLLDIEQQVSMLEEDNMLQTGMGIDVASSIGL